MVKNKRNDKANVDDEERVSMNSLGNLHGRVDFFGIETQRANKPIYQKLNVVQTWVFMEAFMIVLLTAYLIVLSVWLAPFFPANYDTGDKASGNTDAISSLQSDQSNTHGQVDNNTANIGELQKWRRNHTEQFHEMHAAIRKLEGHVGDLQSQMATLNNTANQLEQKVANLTEQNKVQEARITALERKVFNLETAEADRAANSTRSAALTDQNNARIKKLECFKENMTERVGDLDEIIQERFCNITKTLADVHGQCMGVKKQTTVLTARMASQGVHQDIVDTRLHNLTIWVNELEDSNAKDHKEFEQEISGLKTNFSQQINELQNQTMSIGKTLRTTRQGQVDHAQWARESFMEQDNLRAAAMEKQRIMHEARIGKLQCEIDILNATVQENLQLCKTTTTNNTQNAIYQAQKMVEEAKTELQGLVEDTKKNMTEDIKKVNSTLTQKLDAVGSEVGSEIKERELQYVYLCERIDDVQHSSYGNFTIAQAGIEGAYDEIQNLTKEIDSMQEQGIAQEEKLFGLNQEVEKRALEFVQFKAESVATELDLRNQTCSLQEVLSILEDKQAVLIVRVNNSENRINDAEFKLTGAIRQSKVELIRQLDEQHGEHIEIINRTNSLQDAYSQLVVDLGGKDFIKTPVEKIGQILPQLSSPRPVSTDGPKFADSTLMLTARDSRVTTPMSDPGDYYGSDDYNEEEETDH